MVLSEGASANQLTIPILWRLLLRYFQLVSCGLISNMQFSYRDITIITLAEVVYGVNLVHE